MPQNDEIKHNASLRQKQGKACVFIEDAPSPTQSRIPMRGNGFDDVLATFYPDTAETRRAVNDGRISA